MNKEDLPKQWIKLLSCIENFGSIHGKSLNKYVKKGLVEFDILGSWELQNLDLIKTEEEKFNNGKIKDVIYIITEEGKEFIRKLKNETSTTKK